MWYKRTYWILVAALAVIGGVAGCGGSGSSGSAASGSSASASDGGSADSAPSKAQFIKEADEICEKADQGEATAFKAFVKANSNQEPNVKQQEILIKTAALPLIQEEAEKIGDLQPPSGDEDKITVIVKGIETAVSKSEEDVSNLIANAPGPFAGVSNLAREYGFKACSKPI